MGQLAEYPLNLSIRAGNMTHVRLYSNQRRTQRPGESHDQNGNTATRVNLHDTGDWRRVSLHNSYGRTGPGRSTIAARASAKAACLLRGSAVSPSKGLSRAAAGAKRERDRSAL